MLSPEQAKTLKTLKSRRTMSLLFGLVFLALFTFYLADHLINGTEIGIIRTSLRAGLAVYFLVQFFVTGNKLRKFQKLYTSGT